MILNFTCNMIIVCKDHLLEKAALQSKAFVLWLGAIFYVYMYLTCKMFCPIRLHMHVWQR